MGVRKLEIGMVHFKTGFTDGVSLEMDKWATVFTKMGHTVHYCSGSHGTSGRSGIEGLSLPALGYLTYGAHRVERATFGRAPVDAKAYGRLLEGEVAKSEGGLLEWIDSRHLDVVIVENIWSVGLHPALALALRKVLAQRPVQVLSHDHDFYWERVTELSVSCKDALALVDTCLPPHDEQHRHVTINSRARRMLFERKGIRSSVIPNVFDFSGPKWSRDAFNDDFRKEMGIGEHDIVFLQATRIVARKTIELAIELVAHLQGRRSALEGRTLYRGTTFSPEDRIVLLLVGDAGDDQEGYLGRLLKKAERLGVDMRYVGDRIASSRSLLNGRKTYSLWDTYVHADVVTYPSFWEGWGNQLLEAIRAELPVVLFEYPVYREDIAPFGFSMISLGDRIDGWDDGHLAVVGDDVLNRAVEAVLDVLLDAEKRQAMTTGNRAIAERYFSLSALQGYLEPYVETWMRV